MNTKLQKLLMQWVVGIATGIAAHVAASVVMFSGEQIAHFFGHVVALVLFAMKE